MKQCYIQSLCQKRTAQFFVRGVLDAFATAGLKIRLTALRDVDRTKWNTAAKWSTFVLRMQQVPG
jgi:hypothetical protein